jgi:energy-converting hydrogenase Eha subunit C
MDAPIAGFVPAFAAAAIATFLDCYFTMAKSLPRVPGLILVNRGILGLTVLCGGFAVLAFALTDPAGNDVVSTAITLKQTNPLLRGLAVGGMVLVIIRSKLFNVQDSGFGAEAIYTLLRSLALQSVNDTRTQQRNAFLNANIAAAFAIQDYFTQLENTINQSMKTKSAELKQRYMDEVRSVKANVPGPPIDQGNAQWRNYYYSMTGICFDYCSPSVLKGLPGFVGT